MATPEQPKRLVLKLARVGSDQWAVAQPSGGEASTPASAATDGKSSSEPKPTEVKSEPKPEEKSGGKLIIRLKAPVAKRPESDDDDSGKSGAPDAKRQRRPTPAAAAAAAAGGGMQATPVRASQRDSKPAHQTTEDTSSHRDDDEDEIEVSGGSVSGGGGGGVGGGGGGGSSRRERPKSTVMIPLRKAMSSIIAHLIKKDYFGIFYEPVDPEEVHDYYDVIKNPMCFKTIRKKLSDDLYPSLKALEEDVELICNNAMLYNPPESMYHEEAKKLLAESKAKFLDYAPRTVHTLPPKKSRDHSKDPTRAAGGAVGGITIPAPATVAAAAAAAAAAGGVTVPASSTPTGAAAAAAAAAGSAAGAGAAATPLRASSVSGGATLASGARPSIANAAVSPAAIAASNALAAPPGRRYAAAATGAAARAPPVALNNAVLPPIAGTAPGTADAKATYAYNPAVPGRPAGTGYASSTQNYINAPTRPAMPARTAIVVPPVEEQQYQASLENFVKNSAHAQKQVELLLQRLKNPPAPVAHNPAALQEIIADVRAMPHVSEPPLEDIPAVVESVQRDFPGLDLSFLLRISSATRGAEHASAPARDDPGDKEVQRELDRNYESLIRLHQLHHARSHTAPATPAPAETALSHALGLSLALLSAKLPPVALHPVNAVVPSLKEVASASENALLEAKLQQQQQQQQQQQLQQGAASPPAPLPSAMEIK